MKYLVIKDSFLTHSFPVHPFSNFWKHGVEKGCTGDEWAKGKLRTSFKMFEEYFPTKKNIRDVQR